MMASGFTTPAGKDWAGQYGGGKDSKPTTSKSSKTVKGKGGKK